MAHAVVRSLKWLQTASLSDIIKTVPERLLGDRALYLAAFNKARSSFTTDGLMPANGPQTLQLSLARFDETLRAVALELTRTFSNEMAARAKARYKA
jgi:NitT/TauT family transport system substrate-binding protein